MKTRIALLLAILTFTPTLLDAAVLRRFVLVAGANDGGSERVRLRYAVSDAENFVRVLESMGGVAPEDVFLLKEPTSETFSETLSVLRSRVSSTASEGTRREVVVYCSGHADDRGLLLGEERFTYQNLRQQIDDIQADVHITVLDACASGAITRLKGGQRRQAFLVDESSRMKGYAFLTSSSEDEAAQESDQIGASYFTHYLVSGMRGAADASGDGKVTLGEAYQFAFHETLNTTSETRAGAQHPSYDINLTGTGDVVMTDVRQTSAGLVIDKALHGRLYIRNSDQQLVAELYKVAGRSIELGLEPGEYDIRFDQEPTHYEASIEITEGERYRLDSGDLQSATVEQTRSRGDEEDLKSLSMDFLDKMDRPYDGVQLSLVGNEAEYTTGTQIAMLYNKAEGDVSGIQFSLGVNIADADVKIGQISAFFNRAGGSVKGIQLASLVNVTEGTADGVQIATGNFAMELDGVQFSTLNVIKHGQGAQFAAVNLSRGDFKGLQAGSFNLSDGMTHGLQIGAVNLAEDMDGIQLGVLNATWKGLMHTGVWIDESGMPYYTFTTGTRWWYSYYTIGYNPYVTEEPYAFGGGMGAQIKIRDRLFFEIDAGATAVTSEKVRNEEVITFPEGGGYTERTRPWNTHSKLRLGLGVKLAPGVWLYGGASFNVLAKRNEDPILIRPRGDFSKRLNDNVTLWPGMFGGIRFGRS